jgi:hypothetical protein
MSPATPLCFVIWPRKKRGLKKNNFRTRQMPKSIRVLTSCASLLSQAMEYQRANAYVLPLIMGHILCTDQSRMRQENSLRGIRTSKTGVLVGAQLQPKSARPLLQILEVHLENKLLLVSSAQRIRSPLRSPPRITRVVVGAQSQAKSVRPLLQILEVHLESKLLCMLSAVYVL